jgi:hypothetical protein
LSNIAVRKALEETGVHFDLLGFDASQMGQIETAYEFRNVADILVFSQETGEENGWNYTAVLQDMAMNPFMRGEELARSIVGGYRSFYEETFYPMNPLSDQYLTISAISLGDRIGSLATEMDQLAGLLLDGLSDDDPERHDLLLDVIAAAREETQELNSLTTPYIYVDLFDFLEHVNAQLQGTPELVLRNEIETLLAMKKEVIFSEYHGKDRPYSNGLSIVFFRLPEAMDWRTYDPDYRNYDPDTGEGREILFIQDTRWDEFLQTYYQEAGL